MKKIIIILTIICAQNAHSQIALSDSANNTEIKVYAGNLAGSKVSTNGNVGGFCYTRLGGIILWEPSKWFSIYALGAGELDQTGKFSPFGLFGTNFMHKKIKLTLGKVATPMTELRPLPTTSAGQFEPWTRQQILGSALGGKISANFKKVYVVSGVFKRDSNYSLEVGLKISKIQLAGYYMPLSKTFGFASNVNFKNVSTTAFVHSTQVAGMLHVITVPRLKISLYSDIGYDFKNTKLLRGEWGAFKTFHSKQLNALLGLGYSQEIKNFKSYIFIFL